MAMKSKRPKAKRPARKAAPRKAARAVKKTAARRTPAAAKAHKSGRFRAAGTPPVKQSAAAKRAAASSGGKRSSNSAGTSRVDRAASPEAKKLAAGKNLRELLDRKKQRDAQVPVWKLIEHHDRPPRDADAVVSAPPEPGSSPDSGPSKPETG